MTLQSITLSPTSSGDCPVSDNTPTQFTAYGHFIHPVKTVDITNQVTWTSSVTRVATVGAHTGIVVSAGIDFGVTTITATAGKGVIGPGDANEIIASDPATFTVQNPDPNTGLCPGEN